MFWLKPGSPEVILKLRINSGAAFDLAGKSGQMALLGDLLFPDPATIDYFTDEMGGKLDVSVDLRFNDHHDGWQSRRARADHRGSCATRLLSTQLRPEVVTRMRDARIKLPARHFDRCRR